MNQAKRVRESSMKSFTLNDDGYELPDDIDLASMDEDTTLAHFRCPMCGELLVDATRVTPCRDLFCTDCIRSFLFELGNNACPGCMVDLGLDPEEFLSFEEQLSVFVEALAEYFRGRRERDALIAKTREKSEKRYRTVLTKPSSGILTKKRFMTQAKAVGASYAAAVASPVDDSESDRMKVDEEASSCKSKEL